MDGVAATVHSSARFTQDVDVSYSRSASNLERLVATLRAGLNFTRTTTVGDIDLLGEISGGGSYEDLLRDSSVFELYGREVRVVDLPMLIQLKRATGRAKDLDALAELDVLQKVRSQYE